ncbi:hypothetical protein E2C01_074474 [Portunus trituberculatus]|uniref:Uncharacterized protein n=1 Tax=Portunus trituberculatus TaxID=210409 RepID=A0A5B7IEE2_PORTR|nr:hypothetical protein [Portunus trituberculatus]
MCISIVCYLATQMQSCPPPPNQFVRRAIVMSTKGDPVSALLHCVGKVQLTSTTALIKIHRLNIGLCSHPQPLLCPHLVPFKRPRKGFVQQTHPKASRLVIRGTGCCEKTLKHNQYILSCRSKIVYLYFFFFRNVSEFFYELHFSYVFSRLH